MSYRPIADVWILARPKVKYYGAYPSGFLERARVLIGRKRDRVLHVCGGHAKRYPAWDKLCPNDWTLDLDPATEPDYLRDAREPLLGTWDGVLIDPPYTEADAEKYQPGAVVMPSVNLLLRNALAAVEPGGRVGVLHYLLPQPPREGVKFLACVGVIAGYNNRMRVFSVFEKQANIAVSRRAEGCACPEELTFGNSCAQCRASADARVQAALGQL